MPTNTTRLSLVDPIGTDAPSEIRIGATASNAILDNAAIYYQGTLVARPAASSVANGTFYYATDQFTMYVSDATTWHVLGPQLTTTIVGSSATAAYFTSNIVAAGQTLTLPTASLTSAVIQVVAGVSSTGANPVTVSATSINGIGLSGAANFTLGTPYASVTLMADGSHWQIVGGARDTGWVQITTFYQDFYDGSGPPADAAAHKCAVRLIGTRVWVTGTIFQAGLNAYSVGTTVCALPSATFQPTYTQTFLNGDSLGYYITGGALTVYLGVAINENSPGPLSPWTYDLLA